MTHGHKWPCYGGHAIDEQSEGFTPSVVEDAIGNGEVGVGNSGGISFCNRAKNVSVIMESDGKIVTVTFGRVNVR